MADDDDTFISPPDKDDQEVLRDRACELGFLEKDQASELFEEYRQSGMKANFDSFLLAKGVVSVEQVDELHPEDESAAGPPSTERFDRAALLGDDGTGVSDGSTSFLAAGVDDGFGGFGGGLGVGSDDGFSTVAGDTTHISEADDDNFSTIADDGFNTVAGDATSVSDAAADDFATFAGDDDFNTVAGMTAAPAVRTPSPAAGQSTGAGTRVGDGSKTPTARMAAGKGLVGLEFSGCVIERKVGEGGMGSVWLARKTDSGDAVVVKFLNAEQARNPTWRARFVREAEMMRNISHPNIVALYALDGESESPHIVMEYVEGRPLDEELEDRGRFEVEDAARVIRDLARALDKAHDSSIIHRDIKPANALLTTSGVVKMLDFGLAKNEEQDDGLSMAGQILGTPHYMAPEQWGDHQVDARCDIFSLGATFYHLVTGTLPFPGRKHQAIARKMLEGDFVAPRDLVPDMPEDLEFVLFRMLEPDRRFRYPTAKQVADDIDRVLAGKPVNIPCLIEMAGKRRGKRYPLLPGKKFLAGRDPGCAVPIPDSSVSRQHAEVERGRTGFSLRDLGSTYGSFVGGMRVREVVLKDKDEVKLGKIQLQFRDGGISRQMARSTLSISSDKLLVQEAPTPVLMALADSMDKRVAQELIEQLAPDSKERKVEEAWQLLRTLFDGETASQAGRRLESIVERRLQSLPNQLFSITHENRGDDVESWLTWWDGVRERYPTQIHTNSARPPARLKIARGEDTKKARKIMVPEKSLVTIGREESTDIPLFSRSVSRVHATLIKLHARWTIRDEGSRFGTLLNGNKVRNSFLKHGDRLTMGKVHVVYEEAKTDVEGMIKGHVCAVDHEIYFSLQEIAHPSTVMAMVQFVRHENGNPAFAEEPGRLLSGDKAQTFKKRLDRLYSRRSRDARKSLAKVLGGEPGDSVEQFEQRWKEQEKDLPAQVLPAGWFPELEEGLGD